mgnify:FL=1
MIVWKPPGKVDGKHSFNASILNFRYCSKCGLITLKNVKTEKARNKPCPGMVDKDEE